MRAKSARYFEATITYDKMSEDGMLKTINESYAVEAMSFTEGETKVLEEMAPFISGDHAVTKMAIAPYREVWFSDKDEDDKFFKAKLQYITLDEKTEKEKRQSVYYLVQAKNFDSAKKAVEEVMSATMIDYVISSIVETKVLDVFEK